MRDARIGWWQADRKRRMFHISEGLRDLLGLSTCDVSYEEFRDMINPTYREYAFASVGVRGGDFGNEHLYPLRGPKGEIWCYRKLLREETAEDGGMLLTGYFRVTDPPQEANSPEKQQINDLLYRLNSISHTLLSLLKTNDLDVVIDKILTDVQTMFHGGRAYIIEFDRERRTHDCTYEVTAENVTAEQDLVNSLSMDEVPWWTRRIENGNPIIISSLDELPDEAFREKEVLAMQDIKSLIAVPLASRDKVWGYAGIDIVNEPRTWSGEDYQWFASLMNIISLCIELQRSEREAQSERTYLEGLYRHMPLGYARLQMLRDDAGEPVDFRILDANYAADKISGVFREQYIGKRASELGLDTRFYMPIFLQVFDSGDYIEHDSFDEKSKHWIHSILYTTHENEVICLFSDTTDVHNAHEALFNSEKLLRNIFDNVQVGVELYDREGYLVDLNNKDLEIFGLKTKEAVLGVNFFRNPLVPQEIRENVRNGQEQAFKLDYHFNRLDGYYPSEKKGNVQIYTTVTMLYDMYGELINFVVINIDNTEINEAYSRLAEFESSFSLVSRFGKVGYARFDLMTRDGYAVPQWFHNIGERSDTPMPQVIGVYDHVDPEDRAAIFREIGRVKAGESNGFTLDLRVTPEGEPTGWTRVNVVRNPLNTDPSKIEMVCVNFDVTELKQTEKNLIEAKNKAEVSDRLKSAFLANMSHEIRTPLNAIVGFSGLLMETTEQQEKEEYIKIIHINNELLLKLINDILDLSKIESGSVELQYEDFDLSEYFDDMVTSMKQRMTNPGVRLIASNPYSGCKVRLDKNRIAQIMTNYVTNAIKYTRKGFIEMGYESKDEGIRLYVKDSGIGIPEDKKHKVFHRFEKLDEFAQGTGLGLSICKAIAESMGGYVGYESRYGEGSLFWAVLPCNAEVQPFEKQLDSLTETPDIPERKTILVAEDIPSNYRLVSALLEKRFDLIHAKNGREAVEIAGSGRADLVLMDMRMPVMDGLTATAEIRKFDPEIPIVALTAHAFDTDQLAALEAGCNEYLLKPIDKTKLMAVLRKYCHKP